MPEIKRHFSRPTWTTILNGIPERIETAAEMLRAIWPCRVQIACPEFVRRTHASAVDDDGPHNDRIATTGDVRNGWIVLKKAG